MLKDPYTDSDFFEHAGGILPCQLRPGLSSLHASSGERLLMLALLSDAINVFLKGRADRRLLAQTRRWIEGLDAGSQVVSFEDACDAVGVDPEAMRERLFRLKYGDSPKPHSRRPLMLKPPEVSRGPVKVGTGAMPRSTRRRASSSR